MSGWTAENSKKCKIIGDRAGAHVWLCNRTVEYYEHIENRLDLGLTIFIYLLGSGGIPSLFTATELNMIQWINGAIQVLLIIVGVVSTWKKTMDYK